ncbi:MAG: hypothetical protein ACJAWL_002959 [Motiliproteus sp.]|jgi:hypothetical protein
MINSPERVGAMCDALQERMSLTETENNQLNSLLTRLPGGGTQFARIEGYAFGLAASRSMDDNYASTILTDCLKAVDELLKASPTPDDRPGRDRNYSVDVTTERGYCYPFDVPAMNPSDAYYQLSKRSGYKVLPDIYSVRIFEGLAKERTKRQEPKRSFEQSELVFSG